ncbi:hypothetical protein Q2T40_11935 [Winogradskyella maritima]|uniref:Uncharacterized protein n=1 Tax=Winogradskyella maritima TaxID=1517766 RepID=A0ABV8AJF6_9FLAO|nr:hypothetical protein [Winogradskyella maritima]
MNLSRIISLSCIFIGGAIAIYSQAEEDQSTVILMVGIALLMFGIYRVSRHIPSKSESLVEDSFVKSEKIDPEPETLEDEEL